jgi:hypothetical protein
MMRFSACVAFATCLSLVAGCNVFESFYEEGTSDDPEVLLDDARYALQKGDAAKAVVFLEKAYEKDSSNVEVRTELASALLQANDIDVLLLKDLAEYMTDGAGTGAGKGGFSSACTFFGSPDAAARLQMELQPAYLSIVEHSEILDRVVTLVSGLAETGDDLSENQLAGLFTARAIANLSVALRVVVNAVVQAEGAIYAIGGGLGYCAPNELALDTIETAIVCRALPHVDQAVESLDARQAILASDDSEFFELVQDVRDDIGASVTATCDADVRVAG